MKKRLFAVLLCFCLLVGLVPKAVFAAWTDTGKAIQLGTGGISGWDSADGYDYIYFGNWEAPDEYTTSGPLKWRVLDTKTNMDNATEGDGLFLLSEATLGISGQFGGVYFQNSFHSYTGSDGLSFHKGRAPSDGDHTDCLLMNAWQGSEAQDWCKTFYSRNLTTQEQSAVLATTKSDAEFTSSVYLDLFTASENILSGDKIFFLSAGEAETEEYGFDDATRRAKYGERTQYWRLRSPCASHGTRVGGVTGYGRVSHTNAQDGWTVRPAFNLDQNSVLFTSAATGGKADTAVDSSLTAVGNYDGSEWKLTLLDSNRNFLANVDGQTSVSASAGDSVQITYSGAQTGDNEYVSVLLCDSSDTVLYYGNIAQSSENGTVVITIPSGLTASDYTLKVFSEQCNGDYKTDYASAFQNIELEIAGLPQETTPSAVFTATGDNGGTLSNVDTSMKYSVDGGNTWNDITGELMEIGGVTTENGIKVYKQGNGTTTSDSEVQTIDVTQAAQPTSIDKADCTTPQQNDGQITGVDTTMEYRMSGESDWTAVTGNPVTGLTNGTYEIRVKASGTVLASTAATVTIGAHTCAAQGEWQYDGTDHWKLCACGAKVEEAAHSGGTATCMVSAVCEVCGQPYGEKNPNNHTGAEAWITTETTHTKVYSCCQAVIETETAHTWENGKCPVCQYDCTHQGGTATCSQLAQCEICGSLYGSYDESNHKAADTWTQEDGKHYHICEYGCNIHLDEADCSGGTATCTALAVCETCGQTYGVVNPDNHTGKAVWTQTATTHSRAYDCCGAVVIAEEAHEWNDGVCSECGYECQHSGGEATCTQQATCEICNEKYGSLGAHKLSLTTKVEETCTTDGKEAYYTCEVCGKYFEDEAGNTEIANLDEWGIIPAAGHKSGTEWKSDADNHWKECTVAGCGVIIDDSKAAHTASDWIIDTAATETTDGTKHKECTVCGYVLETGTIPATGTGHTHSYGESWKYDADNHWHECSCGAKADEANHVYDNEQDTTCNVCGYVWTVAPTSHSITVQTEGGGTASASPTSATAGTTINLTATPNSGYHFKEWVVVSGGVTISGDSFTMPDENVTVKAVFEQDSTPSQYTVTFETDYGTAPASMTVTEGTAITLPELEDDGDHVFVGWWIIDSSSPFVNLYSAGEEYTVRGNVTCIADWDEIVTLTAPFTTTVELGDYGVPGETVFTLEVVYVNVVEEGEEGREDTYKDVTVSASVTTNGKGDYDGTMTFTGLSGQLRDMLTQGVYVQQVDDGEENWTYDDTVWYLILADEPEVSALTSTHDTAPEYEVQIFRATYEETEYGPVYGLDWENMDWDAPEAKMLFTNIYTAHDYTLKHDETEHWDECGCGDVQNREAHRYGEWRVTKEATKTESGEKEHTCTVCGYTETVEIEKLPHIHDYTLEHNETEHWDECGCGDVQNREAHRYGEWTVTKAATETENGKKEHTCTVCGYTQTAEIEKLPAAETNSHSGTGTDNTDTNAPSPRTGDNSNIVLWFSLMLVAGAALAGTAVYTHKKKRNR